MCWLTLPTIALGLGAIVLSVARAIELGVFAPVATTAFASALGERLACDAIADARRLCACLEPAWAAHLAGEVMDAKMRGDDAHFALECSLVEWRARSLRHLQVICTLGRIAIPLALGCAIVELSLGFEPGVAPAIARAHIASAVDCACAHS